MCKKSLAQTLCNMGASSIVLISFMYRYKIYINKVFFTISNLYLQIITQLKKKINKKRRDQIELFFL